MHSTAQDDQIASQIVALPRNFSAGYLLKAIVRDLRLVNGRAN